MERSSASLVASPLILELTFLNWATLRCVDGGNVLTFTFFPFYAWSIILLGILNVPYMFDSKCMPFVGNFALVFIAVLGVCL